MLGLITGSQVYGRTKKSSDVDLVLRVTREEGRILENKADPELREMSPRYPDAPQWVSIIRYGDLNLILCYRDLEYSQWDRSLAECKAKATRLNRPLTRDEAIEIHRKNRGETPCGPNPIQYS